MIMDPNLRGFVFVADVNAYRGGGFDVRLPTGIKGKRQLLDELAARAKFASYFGHNWDALVDCLRDLSWIAEHTVAFIHPELPLLKESDLRTYLDILRTTALDWKSDESHEIRVIFPRAEEARVRALLGDGAT